MVEDDGGEEILVASRDDAREILEHEEIQQLCAPMCTIRLFVADSTEDPDSAGLRVQAQGWVEESYEDGPLPAVGLFTLDSDGWFYLGYY